MSDQTQALTRRDLAAGGLDALDKQRAGEIAVSRSAGGVSFSSAVEVMEFAKLMAVGGESIPAHLRNNPGVCLRVVFQAIEWGVSPYAVADQSYLVGGRMAYMAQLIHAIVEARAPLSKMLEVEYSGEGGDPSKATRRIKVIGTFRDGEVRDYDSPETKDIKVKNSPLWFGDLDQQLFYFGTRAWARRWVPHVLFGIYTPEEIKAGMAPDAPTIEGAAPLKDRLQGPAPGSEGHAHGHADRELANIVGDGKVEIIKPGDTATPAGGAAPAATKGKAGTKAATKPKAEPKGRQKPKEPSPKAVDHAANKAEGAGRTETLVNPANVMPKSAASAAADRAQATSDARKVQPERKVTVDDCKTPEEYAAYFRAYVGRETKPDDIEGRWDGERDKRDELAIPLSLRKEIEREMIARCEELRK